MRPEWQEKKPQLGNPAQRAKSKQPKHQASDSRVGSGRAGNASGAAAPRVRPRDGAGEGGKASELPRRIPGPRSRERRRAQRFCPQGWEAHGDPPKEPSCPPAHRAPQPPTPHCWAGTGTQTAADQNRWPPPKAARSSFYGFRFWSHRTTGNRSVSRDTVKLDQFSDRYLQVLPSARARS